MCYETFYEVVDLILELIFQDTGLVLAYDTAKYVVSLLIGIGFRENLPQPITHLSIVLLHQPLEGPLAFNSHLQPTTVSFCASTVTPLPHSSEFQMSWFVCSSKFPMLETIQSTMYYSQAHRRKVVDHMQNIYCNILLGSGQVALCNLLDTELKQGNIYIYTYIYI
ncbi:hypothetical protein TorRG33x02_211780 [Trema orientale]|uniref:Uncharacterized protein n=1 Tax=Trema orientale TaxID=63057 RepID=A0A2P5EC00_TREOI|nr:hypothetical protein TorRG33x02_211780 [Trema orientale]